MEPTDDSPSVHLWIDADACPKAVKEILYRAATGRKLPTCLVANRALHMPPSPYLRKVQVEQGFDVADHYIIQHVTPYDIVITEDIPLAALVIEKGAAAISPHGKLFTEENVGERLSVRNFLEDLRESGVKTGGPRPFGPADKHRFASTFDRILTQQRRAVISHH